MFDELKKYLLFLFAALFSATTFAGAVSGGGGGTTNPNPADPYWIVGAVGDYGGPIITMFLSEKEADFEQLSEQEQAKSPYFKLFRSKSQKTIFDVVKQTRVEVRMSEPCYDASGAPWDGSIYSTQADAVCISAFTMAPKLNERNAHIETIALLVHELSHLMGATEEEATAIQAEAVWAADEMKMLEIKSKLSLLAESFPTGKLCEPALGLDYWINVPSEITTAELVRWIDQLRVLRDYELNMSSWLSVLRIQRSRLFTPQFARVYAIVDYIRANDANEDPEIRKDRAKKLATGFGTDSKVTAKQYESRNGGLYLGPEYDDVWIQKLSSLKDVSYELTQLMTYLDAIHEDIKQLNGLKTSVYLKK